MFFNEFLLLVFVFPDAWREIFGWNNCMILSLIISSSFYGIYHLLNMLFTIGSANTIPITLDPALYMSMLISADVHTINCLCKVRIRFSYPFCVSIIEVFWIKHRPIVNYAYTRYELHNIGIQWDRFNLFLFIDFNKNLLPMFINI